MSQSETPRSVEEWVEQVHQDQCPAPAEANCEGECGLIEWVTPLLTDFAAEQVAQAREEERQKAAWGSHRCVNGRVKYHAAAFCSHPACWPDGLKSVHGECCKEAVAQARAEEREACAKVADPPDDTWETRAGHGGDTGMDVARKIAAAIRRRGEGNG